MGPPRRDFHDVWKATSSPIAKQALDQIGALYDIERNISGRSAEIRRQIRQEHSKPRVEAFRVWCETELTRIFGKSDLAIAMRYALKRWSSFTLFLEDGRVAIDNNVAERAIKPVVVTCSLCTLLLSVCKHWKLIFRIGVTRASFSLGQRCRNSLVAQIVGTYLVRRARYDLFGGKDALLNKPADNVIGHAKQFCSFTHRPPFAFLFGGAMQ